MRTSGSLPSCAMSRCPSISHAHAQVTHDRRHPRRADHAYHSYHPQIRIFRAATELNINTVAIYSKEDFGSLHRYKADEAFLVGQGKSPVGAYLAAEEIVDIAVKNDVDAIHPGYGFLSENTRFVELCEQANIMFVGPPSHVIQRFGDKTEARELAREFNVPIVPGTESAVHTVAEAKAFCDEIGYPVICKAAFGGGGRGMRIVRSVDELETNFLSASSEALTAFGNGSMFIERCVEPLGAARARHCVRVALTQPVRCPAQVRRVAAARRGADPCRRDGHSAPLRARLFRPAPPPEGCRGRACDWPSRRARARTLR